MENLMAPIFAAIGTAVAGVAVTVINYGVAQAKGYVEATLIHRTVERGAGLAYLIMLQRGSMDDESMANAVATTTEYVTRRVGQALLGRGLSAADVTEMAKAQIGTLLARDPNVAVVPSLTAVDEAAQIGSEAWNNVKGAIPVHAVGDKDQG